jgi:transcriptional regulator with XRE-family HTH domain
MKLLPTLGQHLKNARKKHFPLDDLQAFSLRIGVARATLQKMEKGDLSVSLAKYYQAAEVLGLEKGFEQLFVLEESLFDD